MGSALNLIYCIILKKSTQLTAFILQKLRLRQQPSLVRKLGPLLFWIKAQRIYLVWKEDVNESCSSYSNHDSESTLSSMREWPENSAVIDCRDRDQMEAKIEEMQQNITQLQAQLSLIIVKIAADERNSSCHEEDASVSSSTSIPSAETFQPHIPSATETSQPPPPPPPPPLPPKTFCTWPNKMSVVVKVKTGDQSYADKRDTKACSIVEELAMKPPKLRHVERSPGGRPVRNITQFTPTNNSDFLTAVLKKRFEAIHSP